MSRYTADELRNEAKQYKHEGPYRIYEMLEQAADAMEKLQYVMPSEPTPLMKWAFHNGTKPGASSNFLSRYRAMYKAFIDPTSFDEHPIKLRERGLMKCFLCDAHIMWAPMILVCADCLRDRS